MANSFTVFPGVIPSNLTVQGNLTVAGDQVRIGAAAPFLRLGKDTIQRARLAFNQALNFSGVDLAATPSTALSFEVDNAIYKFTRQNSAGTFADQASPTAIFTDYVTHSHTGTVTQDTIYSKLIPGNTLGANGGFRIRFAFSNSVQGAGTTVIAIRLGAGSFITFNLTAATQDSIVEVDVVNQNAANAQASHGWRIQIATGTVTASFNTFAVDTSVDQTLSVTVQNANAGDTQSFRYCVVHQLNSFGPV